MSHIRIFALILLSVLGSAGPGLAFEAKTDPEFAQFMAIQPRNDGGFAAAGFFRSAPGKVASGIRVLSPTGTAIGRPIPLPVPDAQHAQSWVSSLVVLEDGDYVATGWTENLRNKPDGWLIKVSNEGEVIWNLALQDDWDQRLYSAKRIAGRRILAVGKRQRGADAKQPSSGYMIVVDDVTGNMVFEHPVEFGGNVARSGLYDAAQISDGSFVAVGWMTKTDGTDDIWLAKLNEDGDRIKSINFGEAKNDVGWAVVPYGDGLAITATVRKADGNPVGAVYLFDRNLTQKGIFDFARWVTGTSQSRAILPVPLTADIITVGDTAKTATTDPSAIIATVQTAKNSVAADTATGVKISSLRSVAVDANGAVAAVGDSSDVKNGPQHGVIGLYRMACDADPKKVEEISALLAKGSQQRLTACASANQQIRYRLPDKPSGQLAVIVRPIVGAVETFLVRGSEIIDASLNERHLAQVLLLPNDARGVEVMVNSVSPFASYELGLAVIPRSQAKAASSSEKPADDTDDNGDDTSDSDAPDVASSLRLLGFDLLAPGDSGNSLNIAFASGESIDRIGIQRAIMALQATEGFAVTGTLQPELSTILRYWASRQIDADAHKAAQIAADVATHSKDAQMDYSQTLRDEVSDAVTSLARLTGGVRDGRVYGQGIIVADNGAQQQTIAGFQGALLGSTDERSRQKTDLGVYGWGNGCTYSGRMQFVRNDNNKIVPDLRGGVLRRDGHILAVGDSNSLQSIAPEDAVAACIN